MRIEDWSSDVCSSDLTSSSHRGAGPGHAITANHTAAWNEMAGRTSRRERRMGCRADNAPTTGPHAINETMNDVTTSEASAGESPSPAVRNGNPHSSPNAVPANGVAKCDQNASRVAGCAHESRNPSRRSAAERTTWMAPVSVSTATSEVRPGGRLRITAKVSTANSAPRPARLPNEIDPDVACSRSRQEEPMYELQSLQRMSL